MPLINEVIFHELKDKNVALLGFGREGKSTFLRFRQVFPLQKLIVADKNPGSLKSIEDDPRTVLISGEDYLQKLPEVDIIIKSPGIPLKDLEFLRGPVQVTSQTDLFLQAYAEQVIGITGTKGKSTTSALIYHLLSSWNQNTIFVGNIGVPTFDKIDLINPETMIVFELSSHQLEVARCSPHIAVLLNIFQEHLDHYHSYHDYQRAKFNIALFQDQHDYFIYCADNEVLKNYLGRHPVKGSPIPFSMELPNPTGIFTDGKNIVFSTASGNELIMEMDMPRLLKGRHNLYNIMASIAVCRVLNVPAEHIRNQVQTFQPLEHRLEFVGRFGGIDFYNDSISTIPESAIEAIKSVENVNTIILGGYDRGIEYRQLMEFIAASGIENILLLGEAGKRMEKMLLAMDLKGKNIIHTQTFDSLKDLIPRYTRPDSVCLLSPAASSYDMFSNFEERGRRFKELAKEIGAPDSSEED